MFAQVMTLMMVRRHCEETAVFLKTGICVCRNETWLKWDDRRGDWCAFGSICGGDHSHRKGSL